MKGSTPRYWELAEFEQQLHSDVLVPPTYLMTGADRYGKAHLLDLPEGKMNRGGMAGEKKKALIEFALTIRAY